MAASSVSGCVPTPPAPPTPRTATDVSASFGQTWNAAIDVFAEHTIPIRTIDRASGLIVAESMRIGREGLEFADCGRSALDISYAPTDATWNLVVRGDSTRATVRATVRYLAVTTGAGATTVECSSRGVWESQVEQLIKTSAEARR